MKLFSKLHFLLLYLVLAIATTSCKKADPEPPLADQLAGEYTGTYYTVGTTTKVNLPATNTAGVTANVKITVTKISDEVVNIQVKLTLTDKAGKPTNSFSNYNGLILKKTTTGQIEGYQGSIKNVSIVNGELSVGSPDSDPTKTVIFYGKKS